MPRKKSGTPARSTVLTPESLRTAIAKRFGEGSIRFANDDKYAIKRMPTGILALDFIVSGGFARGRHTELFGSPNVGKTYTALKWIATNQAEGKRFAFVDVEDTFDGQYASHVGVQDDLDLIPHRHGNQVIDLMETLLRSRLYDGIVCDSIAALLPKSELDADMEAGSYGTAQAKLMSAALRRLTTANDETALVWINQVRENIGVMFGKRTRTSGGLAMSFYAGSRIEMVKTETIKKKDAVVNPKTGKEMIKEVAKGHRVLARLEKDKTGSRPYSETTFVFDNELVGHDPIEDLMFLGRQLGLVKLSGDSWYLADMKDDKQHGRARFKKWLRSNVAIAEELEEEIRSQIGTVLDFEIELGEDAE